jgi:leucine dehydrogenase
MLGPRFDDHELVSFHFDKVTNLHAIIALHNLNRGPALGGCRMRAYPSLAEAVDDVLDLSRAMSYKNALGERPFGGGKAVILGNPSSMKTGALLDAFGKAVEALGGCYITAEDSGTGPQDIKRISRTTAHVRNIAEERGGPAPYTAYGVFIGIKAATQRVLNRSLEGCVVSVQGLGGVGMELCRWLNEAGARLIVSDIDTDRSSAAARLYDAEEVDPRRAHAVPCDIFAPCAFGGVVNATSAREIEARIVAGSANNQLATPRDGRRLMRRGIVYCPDYVINAGGIRATAAPNEPFDHEEAMRRVEGIGPTLVRILKLADELGRPSQDVADDLARATIAASN